MEKNIVDTPFRENCRRFYPYVKPYLGRAILAVCLAIPVGTLDAIIAWILKPYMDGFMGGNTAQGITAYFPLLIVIFAVMQSALNYGTNYLNTWVGKHIANDLKMKLFDKLITNDAALFDRSTSGEILLRFNTDADTSSEGLLSNLKLFTTRSVSSLALIFVLFYNSWILAVVAVGALVLAVIPLSRVRKKVKRLINESVTVGAAVTTNFNEAYSGNRVIASYNLYDFMRAKLKTTLNDVFRITVKMVQRTNILTLFMHFGTSIGIAATVWLQGYLIASGRITPGNFVSFMAALLMLYTPIKNLSNNYGNVQTSFMAINRVLNLLESSPKIQDKPSAVEAPKITQAIRYDNVYFEYDPGKPVLKHINLEINAGQSVAFVGDSGGGKSTLVNLLPRFYDVGSGAIMIDGIDIRDMTLHSLREQVSIVFQDNFLFGGTLRDNILLGNLTAGDEEVQAAVKAACLDEFIAGLELGLDTEIGERGILLSGGQKQRVAIARAFIKDAPIVILDEATSALDYKSETVVQQAIENLMRNKTVLIIAHRLSTVINANKLVVLKDGQIVETGKHDELISAGGAYSSLYKTQLR
jgi:ABC-type multidrug transport system, ATPase and permease components